MTAARRGSRALRSFAALTAMSVVFVSAAASAPGPGAFYAGVKRAELQRQWGRVWEGMYPPQRKFISRRLFVTCFERQRIVHPALRHLSVVRVAPTSIVVPGTKISVAAKVVRVRIDYGSRAPTQVVTGTVATLDSRWYWVNTASSRSEFKRINFCS